jgi:hypothetical protein
MDMNLEVRDDALNQLAQACQESGRSLRKELRIAISKAAKRTEKHISRDIRKRLNVDKKDVLSSVVSQRASNKETTGIPTAAVIVKHNTRMPLKRFNTTRQIKKGVSYKIDKTKKRNVAASAFGPNIAKLGNHVFVRYGKKRLPIKKLYGLSAWGMFVQNSMDRQTEADAGLYLQNEVERRVNFILLKHFGKI